jgi:hypothetical protein
MRTRGERRHHAERSKARTKRTLQIIWGFDAAHITPKRIGRNAAMHCTCPCWMCTNKGGEHPKHIYQPKLHEHNPS